MSTHPVDARNLLCPMPVIRVQDAIAELAPGETVVVSCTDPGALNDIPAWCRINGHRVVATTQAPQEITITIEVGRDGT